MPSLSSPRRLSLINLTLHRRAICVAAKETLLGDKRAENVTDLGPTGFKLLPESFKPELRNSCVIVATTGRKYLFERNTRDVPCELHQGQISLLPRFNRKQKTKKKASYFSHKVSFVVFHPRRADEVVLLAPPVPEAAEEVVGEESIDGVPNDVDVHRLLYPEPGRDIMYIYIDR